MKVYHCDGCADSHEPDEIVPLVTVTMVDGMEKHFCSQECFVRHYIDHNIILKNYKRALLWAVQATHPQASRIFYVITPDDPGWRSDLAPLSQLKNSPLYSDPEVKWDVMRIGAIVVNVDEVLPTITDQNRWVYVPLPNYETTTTPPPTRR